MDDILEKYSWKDLIFKFQAYLSYIKKKHVSDEWYAEILGVSRSLLFSWKRGANPKRTFRDQVILEMRDHPKFLHWLENPGVNPDA